MFSQFFCLPPLSLITSALRLLDQHPGTSRSLPMCNLIVPHWGSHQPLKRFFPDSAKFTFRLLPSTADLQHVCVPSKSCSICHLRWYSGTTWAYLTSVVAGFKASCLMLIIWFWDIDTRSLSCKTFVGKRQFPLWLLEGQHGWQTLSAEIAVCVSVSWWCVVF